MNEEKNIDLDEIRLIISKGAAICSLMTGFSEDEVMSSSAVRAIGIQFYDQLKKIQELLHL